MPAAEAGERTVSWAPDLLPNTPLSPYRDLKLEFQSLFCSTPLSVSLAEPAVAGTIFVLLTARPAESTVTTLHDPESGVLGGLPGAGLCQSPLLQNVLCIAAWPELLSLL